MLSEKVKNKNKKKNQRVKLPHGIKHWFVSCPFLPILGRPKNQLRIIIKCYTGTIKINVFSIFLPIHIQSWAQGLANANRNAYLCAMHLCKHISPKTYTHEPHTQAEREVLWTRITKHFGYAKWISN